MRCLKWTAATEGQNYGISVKDIYIQLECLRVRPWRKKRLRELYPLRVFLPSSTSQLVAVLFSRICFFPAFRLRLLFLRFCPPAAPFFPPRARYILDVSFFSALLCCPAYNARFTAGVLDYFVLLFLLQFIKLPVIVSFRHSTRKVHTLRPVAQTRPGILFPRYPCFLKEN